MRRRARRGSSAIFTRTGCAAHGADHLSAASRAVVAPSLDTGARAAIAIIRSCPTARLARELSVSRRQMHTLRHRVQENLYQTLPTDVRDAEVQFECDELYQNSGESQRAASGPRRPAQKAGQQGARARELGR